MKDITIRARLTAQGHGYRFLNERGNPTRTVFCRGGVQRAFPTLPADADDVEFVLSTRPSADSVMVKKKP